MIRKQIPCSAFYPMPEDIGERACRDRAGQKSLKAFSRAFFERCCLMYMCVIAVVCQRCAYLHGKRAAFKAALKLQAVMRVNPRRLRPSLRKHSNNKTQADTKGDTKQEPVVKAEQRHERKRVLPSTEVWEVESESEVEILCGAMAAPNEASQPKVACLDWCNHGTTSQSVS